MKSVEKLNEELFGMVQKSQGYAFISDGMGSMPECEFWKAVRQARKQTYISAHVITKFLRKHRQRLREDDGK